MSYFIVNTDSGKEHNGSNRYTPMVYDNKRGAQIACSKLSKKTNNYSWEVMDTNEWKVIKAIKFPVKMVKRVNLMSGLEYEEPEDTPVYCSPAFESYWSA